MSRPSVLPPPASPRWLRTGALVATERLRPSVGSPRRRAVCGASRVLTGLGVRVVVRAPSAPWPRAGRDTGLLLVANAVSPLDPLVLQTALPGVLVARHHHRIAGVPVPTVAPVPTRVATALRRGTPVVVRPEEHETGAAQGRFSPALFAAAAQTGAPVCPVAVRYRGAGDPPATRSTVAALRWLGAAAGVVVEVDLLPALSSADATAEELATLAEYAVAAVLEAPSSARPPGIAAGARPEPARGGGQRCPPTR